MSRLYIARAPSFSSLEAFIVDLVVPKGTKGAFPQALKSKCRELARADSSILVAPTTESLNAPFGVVPPLCLWLITKNGHASNPKLREKLQQLEFKLSNTIAVNHSILQACYQFTLTARLAPKWNQVTQWLIKGTEFLTTGKAHALSLEVGVTGSEITLTMSVSKLTINFIKPEDLGVTTTTLNRFNTEPNFVIKEMNIYNNRCLLLPNFTVGYIYSASHQVPSSPQFPSYDKLRLHWKKQHGIILPERQDLFYQVFFKSNPSNLFTYPGCNVCRGHPLAFPSRDTDAVAGSFVADIHARMPTICGEPVKFSNKALTPFSQLLQANSYTLHSNIRVAATTRPLGAQIQSLKQGIQPQKITPTAPSQAAVASRLVPSIEPPRLQPSARVVPIFQPKPIQKSAIQTAQEGSSQQQRPIVPTFKPTFTSKAASSQQLNVSSQKVAHSITPRGPSQTVPTSRASSSITSQTVPSMSAGAISKPRPSQTVPTSRVPSSITSQTVPSMSGGAISKPRPATQGSSSVNKPATKRPNSSAVPPPSKRPCLTQNQPNPQPHGPNMPTPSQQIVPDLSDALLQSSHEVSFIESSSTKTTVNKPTATPQKKNPPGPQKKSSAGAELKAVKQMEPLRVEGVPEDVIKKILKTKAALLKKWLQENGVKCRSKDKKDDLARMAAMHIKESGKTFEVAS